jgi:hypothetical protein
LTFIKRCLLAFFSIFRLQKYIMIIMLIFELWIYTYPSKFFLFVFSGVRIFEDITSHKVCTCIYISSKLIKFPFVDDFNGSTMLEFNKYILFF